jgi:predicted DNA-binding protein YlxM (UPF0122 family)
MPQTEKWSLKSDHCINCGRNDLKHVARGLCLSCYRKETEERNRGKQRKTKGLAAEKLTQEYLLEEYLEKKRSLGDIAKENECSRQFVYKKLLEHNITRRNLKEARKLAYDQRKISYTIIDEAGEERIITHKGFEIDENFFKVWSKEMAYVLGVLYTDGNLYHDQIRKTYRVTISQKEPELLNKLIKLMKLDYIPRYRKQRGIAGAIYMIDLQQKEMYDDLMKLGLHPNKSLSILFPEVPDEFVRHFLRGCWDGDGSIFFDKSNLIASYVTGSKKFIERLVEELYKVGIRKTSPPYKVKKGYKRDFISTKDKIWEKYPNGGFPLTVHLKNVNSYYIKIQTNDNIKRLFGYFYDGVDEAMFLKRKYDVFVKGLSIKREDQKDQMSLDLPF